MIVVIPDLHLTLKEPFYSAQKEFLHYLKKHILNKGTTLIQLGDFFDKYNPEPKLVNTAIHFLENEIDCKSIILAGNNTHEVNKLNGNYAIQNLDALDKIDCVYSIKRVVIDNLNILLIPAIPDEVWKTNYKSFQEYLEFKIGSEYNDLQFDYVFTHLNTTESLFRDYVSLDFIKCKKENIICGHIHNKMLGTCQPMNISDYKYQSKVMVIIDKEVVYVDIPKFINYIDVKYPDDFDTTYIKDDYTVYNYVNIISEDKKTAEKYYKEKYKDVYIYDFTKIETKSKEVIKEKVKDKDYLKSFCVENKVNYDVESLLYKYFKKELPS